MKEMPKPLKQGSAIGGEAGSTIVEMAFVLPLFLLLTFGIFEFGRAWLTVNTMHHATRESVRLAATTAGLTANQTSVVKKAKDILAAAGLSGASVTNTGPSGTPPQVTVTTTLSFNFLTGIGPLFGFKFPGTIPLTSLVTMRYER
jgi:Flp pilus assembly protein TadG